MQPKLPLYLVIICTLIAASSGVPVTSELKQDILTVNRIKDMSEDSTIESPNTSPIKSTINWQPCTKPEFKDWFNSYTQVELLQCTTIDIVLDKRATPFYNKLIASSTPDLASKTVNIRDKDSAKDMGTATEESPNTVINPMSNEETTHKQITNNPITNNQIVSGFTPNSLTKPTIITLAVSRLAATGSKDQKIGSVISIAGGPGQSGLNISALNTPAFRRLSKHFDIIGYAPRGVSPSTPAINCNVDRVDMTTNSKVTSNQNSRSDQDKATTISIAKAKDSNTDDLAPTIPPKPESTKKEPSVYPSTSQSDASSKTNKQVKYNDALKFAQACWQQTPPDLLTQLGADYAVDDIEAIRQALAEPQISLIGYSYGTKIATIYAEKYTAHLRAAVLDGVVNLNEPEMQMRIHQEASMQQTFERFVADCLKQPSCYFADTKTLKEAEAKLAKLYQKFEDNEVYDFDDERIYPYTLGWEINGLLMWREQWTLLNELLVDLNNDDFDFLRYIIDYSKEDLDDDTFIAIICADIAPDASQKEEYIQQIRRIGAISTWDNYRTFSDDEMVDGCYYWPVAGSDVTHIPKIYKMFNTNVPLLLVAQTGDPATPYINALAMQKYVDGVLITHKGDGHTMVLTDTSSCVDNRVVDYLIDPLSFNHINNKNILCEDKPQSFFSTYLDSLIK